MTLDDGPPADPAPTEASTADHEDFARGCAALVAGVVRRLGHLQTMRVSRSDQWGIIWRADLLFNERELNETKTISRIVCWSPDGTVENVSVIYGWGDKPLP